MQEFHRGIFLIIPVLKTFQFKHSLFQNVVLNINCHHPWHHVMTCETQITVHPVKNPGDMKQEQWENIMCMPGSQIIYCVRVRL
jgi:hypothetical protein